MAQAKRLCPQALIVPPRMGRYVELSQRVFDVFHDFSPLVEPLSLDEAFIDLTGTHGVHGPPERAARAIKKAVTEATGGLHVSVGVAASKYVAKVASDLSKPDGLLVVPEVETRAFLDPLPVKRLWRVGPKSAARLDALGLRTIGTVARCDLAWLQRELGQLGPHVWHLAQGDDPRPVLPDRAAHSIGSEETLMQDARGGVEIARLLRDNADRVARRLRRVGLVAGGVRVKLKTTRFQVHSRQTVLHPPTSHADDLHTAAVALLGHFDLAPPMRLVGLAAFDLRSADEPVQGELFDGGKRDKDRRLDRALDALKDRFGRGIVQRGTALHGPDRGLGPRK
jgi:DNA polymerase-4